MRKHVKILGWLHILLGCIDLLIGLTAFGIMTGIGALSGDIAGFGVMSALGGLMGAVMLIMALPNFICGLGLLRNWGGWVLILAVLLGIFNVFKIPYGTAIAFYTFWIAYRLYQAGDGLPAQ